MSSAVSTRSADNPTQRWWSIKGQSSSTKQSTGPLTNLATAMGFKSKKHPTMSIQQPPLTVRPIITSPLPPNSDAAARPRSSPKTPTRPASKSVSSTRSRVDSIGPKTPVDGPSLHRQSLLTLSDIDPFAARITLQHSPTDPNRLSAYSVPSSPDYISKKSDPILNRGSYASSSSHSNFQELSPLSSPASLHAPSLSPSKRRMDITLASGWQNGSGLVKSESASTITDHNRLSQPDPAPKPRPPMRARGMTDGGVHPRFFRNEPSKAVTRRNGPTAAPPSHELPRPPTVDLDDPSSSFAPVMLTLTGNKHYIPNDTEAAFKSLQAPRAIKKAVSQQSLTKHTILPPSTPSAPVSPSEPPMDRSLRKQRSFHHPRIPLPSIPLPFHSSQPTATMSPDAPIPDSRRSSTVTNPGRKRLFSSSSMRRPSTSNTEDDTRSIFSLRSDIHAKQLNSSTSNIVTSHPSFWDESGQVTPSSPEWQPQQIMSPADMAKLEARMEKEQTEQLHQRRRGMSVLSSTSTLTTMSDRDIVNSGKIPSRTSSLLAKKVPPSETHSRPSTSHATMSTSSPSLPLSEPRIVGLAPPRSWQHPSADHHAAILPLSPPPRRLRRKVSAEHPVSLEKSMRRRSIMRKPSFLDIDDDKDTDTESVARKLDDSFLDLARESFDTVRSIEE